MIKTVEQAKQALWAYINSLAPDERAKAIAYQRGLEEEAARTEGGMLTVISRRMIYNAFALDAALAKVQETLVEVIAADAIHQAMKGKH
jgi:hypothetical protein